MPTETLLLVACAGFARTQGGGMGAGGGQFVVWGLRSVGKTSKPSSAHVQVMVSVYVDEHDAANKALVFVVPAWQRVFEPQVTPLDSLPSQVIALGLEAIDFGSIARGLKACRTRGPFVRSATLDA